MGLRHGVINLFIFSGAIKMRLDRHKKKRFDHMCLSHFVSKSFYPQ